MDYSQKRTIKQKKQKKDFAEQPQMADSDWMCRLLITFHFIYSRLVVTYRELYF